MSRTAIVRELVRMEWRWQSREFLTWLSVLVFAALTIGYTGSSVVDLVPSRGPGVSRTAPWALAHAMAGVTAFGQVITAIIAATTVLRDVALRTQALILATPMAWRDYLVGRYLGVLVVMLLVYGMIPLGLALGAWSVPAPDTLAFHSGDLVRPLLGLVVPNVIVISTLFFCAGALSGGFAVILLLGVALIGAWQTGMGLLGTDLATIGVLVDPFGNAALSHATNHWTFAQRNTDAMPMGTDLLINRAVWLSVAALAGTWTLRMWRPDNARSPSTQRAAPAPLLIGHRTMVRVPPISWGATVRAEWRFGVRWTLRERGVQALALLGILNAVANGWRVATTPDVLLQQVEFHSRLFGVLIATIYAGELVWRDRDLRVHELLGAVAVSPAVRLAGRVLGVLTMQGLLIGVLWGVVVLLPMVRGATPTPVCAAQWLVGSTAPAFAALTLIALTVHLVVQRKAVAHLLIISAWVVAIVLGAKALYYPRQLPCQVTTTNAIVPRSP